MLRIVSDGENRSRLETSSGVQIGWIRGRVIGFCGFASEADAMRGAVAASRALEELLRRHFPGRVRRDPDAAELRIVHDGAYDWISDGLIPIARLVRVRWAAPHDAQLGIELVLPSYTSDEVVGEAVRRMIVAIGSHPSGAAVPDEPRVLPLGSPARRVSRIGPRQSSPRRRWTGGPDDAA